MTAPTDAPALVLAERIAEALDLEESTGRSEESGRYWSRGGMGIWNRRTTMTLATDEDGVMVLHWPPNQIYSFGIWIGFNEAFIREDGDASKQGLFIEHHQFPEWNQGAWSEDSRGTDLLTEHERQLARRIDDATDGLITYAFTNAGETACLDWLRGKGEPNE